MSEDRTRHDVLVRITENPELARAVPLLRPDLLHAVITHCGLQDCGEFLALATSQQLSAVFDLDLWKAGRASLEERFDAARFCEWLEVLVDASPALAATRLAAMDPGVIVAGLAPTIRIFDPGVFEPVEERNSAEVVVNPGRERGMHAEIGGYVVVAQHEDAWDAIVGVLRALEDHKPEAFHRVMRGCQSLSNAGRELDGLDDLLQDSEQVHFDLSSSREDRRGRLGFLPPREAHAFLESARHTSPSAPPTRDDIFAAYQRSLAMMSDSEAAGGDAEPSTPPPGERPVDPAVAVAGVIEVLRDSGVLADAPQALLPAATDEPPANAALMDYLARREERDATLWGTRDQELAFLANALVAGCSLQGRTFARQEAMDAVAAICNLGLELWPRYWPTAGDHDLIAVFKVGWTSLHRDVSMIAGEELLRALEQVRTGDADLEFDLHALRRELGKALSTGRPWRARDRLDTLAALDPPAWAALTALFDECPVMLANVRAPRDRRRLTVDPREFEFVASAAHVAAIHEFLQSLTDLLAS